MIAAYKQLDKRLGELKPVSLAASPARGWKRAIREALGMTMGQFALRLGVSKLRAVELERAKVDGSAPLKI